MVFWIWYKTSLLGVSPQLHRFAQITRAYGGGRSALTLRKAPPRWGGPAAGVGVCESGLRSPQDLYML